MFPLQKDVEALLTTSWGDVSVRTMATAAGIFIVSVLLAHVVRRAVRTARKRASSGASGAFYIAERLSWYVVLGIGVVVAVSQLGVNMTTVSLLAGAIGVGVGLGLQDTVKNFMAGIFLLMDRSIEVGDFIELDGGVAGEVRSVGSRVTEVITNDNVAVLVPNGLLQQNKLTNWTRNRQTRRIHIPFQTAYGVDKELVRKAVFEAARQVPFTLPDDGERRTQVWLTGFAENGYRFELVVWPAREAVKRPGAMHAAYTWAIDDALRRHGIEIPYPQLDLRVRRVFGREGDDALTAIGHPPPRKAMPERLAQPSRNDAAEDLVVQAAAEQKREEANQAAVNQGPSTT